MRMVPACAEDILSGRTFYEQNDDHSFSEVDLIHAAYGVTMGGPAFLYRYHRRDNGDWNDGNIYLAEHSLENFHKATGSTPHLWVDANSRINNPDKKSALELLIRLDIIIDSFSRSKAEKHICPLVDAHPEGAMGVLNDGYKLNRMRYILDMADDGSLSFRMDPKESYFLKPEFFLETLRDTQIVRDITAGLVEHRELLRAPAMAM